MARSIFEDVAETTPADTPQGGMIDAGRGGARIAIRAWLILLGVLVVLMVVVGGLTRLTDSGLSITEWAPLRGAIPPLNPADWAAELERYRAIPEYQIQNKGMTMAQFKFIYWWEWGHRQLGRFVGLVWGIGFLYFLLRRQIPVGWTPKLLLLGALGGLQGAIGWWMVASGLTGTMLDVASYRLATHLGLAFVIVGFITWYALQLSRPERELMQARRSRESRLFGLGTVFLAMCLVQIILGALVAGIDAGRAFPTWPLMGDGFFPPDPFAQTPVWRNFFEDAGLVQFIHRMMGYALLAFGLYVGARATKSTYRATRKAFAAAGLLLIAQMVIGIVTVLYSAPLEIAIFHQLIAVFLWLAIIRARFYAGYPLAGTIRDGV